MTDERDDLGLTALDERARAAVARLDAEISDEDVPSFTVGRRSRTPLLFVAAAVLAVALAGAAVARFDRGDEQSTVAGEGDGTTTGEFVRLALPQPESLGFEVSAGYDGTTGSRPSDADSSPEHHIQAPIDADDPWAQAVEVAETVEGPVHLYGQLVDVAGFPGALVAQADSTKLTWRGATGLRSLASTALGPDALVDLATEAVRSGWDRGEPLPGHRVLEANAGFDDVAFVYGDDRLDAAVIAYTRAGGPSFVLGSLPGGEGAWRSREFWAGAVERATVRGQDAMVLSWPGSLPGGVEITWRETDGTVARVRTWDDPETILPVLDRLQPVDGATFADLVDPHPPGDRGPLIELPPDAFDRRDPFIESPDELLAEVSVTAGATTARARVHRSDGGPPAFDSIVTSAGGGSGQGAPVPPEGYASAASSADDDRDFVFAIVPDRPVAAAFRASFGSDATALAAFETTPVAGTSLHLLVGWTEGPPAPFDDDGSDPWNSALEVTLASGSVVRIAV